MISLILFWGIVFLVIYSYFLFPALVIIRGLLMARPYRASEDIPSPKLSVIIAAHNEAGTIKEKLENIYSLDYPDDSIEVVIASDGSDDGTDEIVRGYAKENIQLLSLPRQGKIPALNAAAKVAKGEILVFSDANSMYANDAFTAIVRPFADPEVGGVAGDQRYLSTKHQGMTGEGEGIYWSLDRILKRFQSRAGSVISATGAIYAIRRELFREIPIGVTDDFVASTSVIAQGYRLIFAEDAIAYEPVAASSGAEFERKVRVITQGFRSVLVMHNLLNPFKYGFYALQLFSHKVLRRLLVFPLLLFLIVCPTLWQRGFVYQAATIAQAGFYGCCILALLLRKTGFRRLKILSIPFFICLAYAASLLASINLLRGHRIDLWEPQRQEITEKELKVASNMSVPSERSTS
jgi:cellulose synthase/poly-beta-1,6-N-acetylglucosamine synthase-like glycosyltransferase